MNRDNRNYGNEYIDFWKMMSKKLIENFNSETLYGQLVKEITMKQKASKALETVMPEEIVKLMNFDKNVEEIVKLMNFDKNVEVVFGRDRESIVFQKRYTLDYDVCYDTEEEVIAEACCVLKKAISENKLSSLNMMFEGNSLRYSVFLDPIEVEKPLKSDSQHDNEKKVCSMMMPQIYDAIDLDDVRTDYTGTIKHTGDVVGMVVDDEPANGLGCRKLYGMQIREAIMLADPTYNKIYKTVSEIIGTIKTKFPNKWKYFAGNFVYNKEMKCWMFCYQVEEVNKRAKSDKLLTEALKADNTKRYKKPEPSILNVVEDGRFAYVIDNGGREPTRVYFGKKQIASLRRSMRNGIFVPNSIPCKKIDRSKLDGLKIYEVNSEDHLAFL